MQLLDFLETVITTPEGFFCLSVADKNYRWTEFFYRWPADKDKIVHQAHEFSQQYNVYFSSHLFASPSSTKDNVLPTRTIQADLDYANALGFSVPPTVTVETSPNRSQGYWVLDGTTTYPQLEELERLSRKLTYAIPDADRSGWTLGHRLRLPETFNYKYDIPHQVMVINAGIKRVGLSELEILPDIETEELKLGDEDNEWIKKPHEEQDHNPQEAIAALLKGGYISIKTRMQYNKEDTNDRSGALWHLMMEMFAAGFNRDDVYWLAYNSENNKWKHNVRDLRKDVIRAERKRGAKTSTLRALLHDMRNDRTLGPMDARLDKIGEMITQDMRSKGRFYHVRGNRSFYCETNVGVPGELPSNAWQTKATIEYGVNSSTQDFRYITHDLIAFVRSIGAVTDMSSLSFYDQSARTVLLHSGGRDVYVIKANNLSIVPNGSTDILFNVNELTEPFTLDYRTELPRPWYELLFSSSMDYVDGIDKKQAVALMAVWFMYAILRKGFTGRPLLALIGQPGSGKSVLCRIIYKLLYGKDRDLHQITDEDDYDILADKYPIVFYDNLDTYDKWIADRLATSITESEVEKRQLFTDFGTIMLRRSAMIGVTSHDPKFLRADVVDRLILLNFRRRRKPNGEDDFGEEKVLMSTVARYRNAIWAAIVEDLKRFLNTPKPGERDVPNYRIQDFAMGGTWVAKALGIEDDFVKGLIANKSRQSNTTLEQEALLVQVLEKWVTKHPDAEYVTVSDLYTQIVGMGLSSEQENFKKSYRNFISLGNKMFTLHNALRQQFDIEFSKHPRLESRVWRIKPKGYDGNKP